MTHPQLRYPATCLLALGMLAATTWANPGPAARDMRPLGPVAPTDARGQAQTSTATTGPGAARTAGALAVVLVLIFVGAGVFRKVAARHHGLGAALGAAGRAPAGILEIVGRYPLGRGNSLILLRLDRRILLLSQTVGAGGRGLLRTGSASLTTLCDIASPEDVASILARSRDAAGESLAARFQSLLGGLSEGDDTPMPPPPPSAATTHEGPAVVVRAGSWPGARTEGADA